ncbi:hypothetical protein J3A64_002777 [Pseudarthrobacter sp. PvP004]|nr:hypothetical protein [Pseudarthrobacter sp. PvP004]
MKAPQAPSSACSLVLRLDARFRMALAAPFRMPSTVSRRSLTSLGLGPDALSYPSGLGGSLSHVPRVWAGRSRTSLLEVLYFPRNSTSAFSRTLSASAY